MGEREKLKKLRERMKRDGTDAVYIGMSDPHQSEGIAPHWRAVQWVTGFTGTAGFCVVTLSAAAIWSDGRYATQMEREVDSGEFCIFNTSDPETPDWMTWLSGMQKRGDVLSVDQEVLSLKEFRMCEAALRRAGICITYEKSYVKELWNDRPPIPENPIWELEASYAGETRTEKISRVRRRMCEAGGTAYLACCLDAVAWLTNLRGGDHPLYPVFHGYLLITRQDVFLCVDKEKISPLICEHLEKDGITICPRQHIRELILKLPAGETLLLDPYKTALGLYTAVPEAVHVAERPDLITLLKGRKNETEQENIRKSNLMECVAVCRFIRHIYQRLEEGDVTEYELGQELEDFRKMEPEYLQPANLPIIAYGENAALPHYRPAKESSALIGNAGMLLFDICAHYKTGTTDLTRVIPVGPCTKEMRTDYTLTLKSHIALAVQRFVYGITGDVLDGIAKSVQWNHHLHYGHGTGHGMGYLLYVHEGPGKIITEYSPVFPYAKQTPVDVGMLFSNEPGVYKPGRHGVRLENNLLVQEDCKNEFGRFLKFETVTFCPFERSLILPELLTEEERNWINDYHAQTFEKLSPWLNEEECGWLKDKTKPI